jgi:hypothetical protein
MLAQKELFDLMLSRGLNPNQYYLLASIHDNLQTKNINVALELSALIHQEFLIVTKDDKLIMTDKGKKMIKSVESLFAKLAKNGAVEAMGEAYEQNIKEYNELFPTCKLPTGKYARTNVKNLKNAFKWFFDNFDYTWDTILEATERYVDEYERNNYKFMRTSQYFVRKQDTDKSYSSDLANYCEIVLSGEVEEVKHFSTRVV